MANVTITPNYVTVPATGGSVQLTIESDVPGTLYFPSADNPTIKLASISTHVFGIGTTIVDIEIFDRNLIRDPDDPSLPFPTSYPIGHSIAANWQNSIKPTSWDAVYANIIQEPVYTPSASPSKSVKKKRM